MKIAIFKPISNICRYLHKEVMACFKKHKIYSEATFETSWLQWPFERTSRQFRIYVIEPAAYAPKTHGDVFDAVFNNFFDAAAGDFVSGDATAAIRETVEADLIVFPEAFLAAKDLVQAMLAFVDRRFQCCVHVGLRPSLESGNHLFSNKDIEILLTNLKSISELHADDLKGFELWFGKQRPNGHFNLGCMFLVDPNGSVRVCLHPKSVLAGVEYSALIDAHMTAGNLLSLVTLIPLNSRYMSVTIQPLICADALSLPTDSMTPNPIKAFADSGAACFPNLPADHIDIVSLSLCTPVGEVAHGKGIRRRWKHEFESAFLEAGKRDDCFRHHFASFIMANFYEIDGKNGGLSGACIPMPFQENSYPEGVSMWSYGQHESCSMDGWKCVAGFGVEHAEIVATPKSNRRRPNLVCLDGAKEPASHAAMALGFTLPRLVRDNPVNGVFPGLTKLDVRSVRNVTTNTAEQG